MVEGVAAMKAADEIRVFSPSYQRGGALVDTAAYLPGVTMVVHEFEAAAYRKSGHKVLACPDNLRGNIAKVRNWILDENRDCRGVVMVDDDCTGVFKWENQKSRRLDADEVDELLEHGFAMAEQWGAYLWGMGMVFDKGAYRENTPFCTVRPVLGSFCGVRPGGGLRYDEAFKLKEDFDFYLQHLEKHRVVFRFNAYQYLVKHNKQTGGCAGYRTVREERAQFALLQEKWGSEIVRVDTGESKAMVRGGKEKAFDPNPWIVAPIAGV